MFNYTAFAKVFEWDVLKFIFRYANEPAKLTDEPMKSLILILSEYFWYRFKVIKLANKFLNLVIYLRQQLQKPDFTSTKAVVHAQIYNMFNRRAPSLIIK